MTEPDQVDTREINDHIRFMVRDDEIEADPDCAQCALGFQLGVWHKWGIDPDDYNRTDVKFTDRWPPEDGIEYDR